MALARPRTGLFQPPASGAVTGKTETSLRGDACTECIAATGLGFLAASLLSLVIVPLVHSRSARLTKRRLEASMPLSIEEARAEREHLRAEFAMSTRRLEIRMGEFKARVADLLAELGKKTVAINRLKLELVEKTATIFALNARYSKIDLWGPRASLPASPRIVASPRPWSIVNALRSARAGFPRGRPRSDSAPASTRGLSSG